MQNSSTNIHIMMIKYLMDIEIPKIKKMKIGPKENKEGKAAHNIYINTNTHTKHITT